ncbi:DUF885 domain-containing protein [Nocardiopsis sp. HNM0947]|uniref:DUF885 domain-containing protein n=1 Tax=Nocardiopsis coralli TaxID=2772213 RepID=A0ABR9P0P7_9ACTN|nr:DUF885 domain-containing protein [Nocardiopsis coralli]MBE2997431.1 DUF885 domain-containing protein [Nocardiopsis coralli]
MTLRFRDVAERVVDALLEASPEWALDEGDTRGAHRLTDHSAEGDVRRTAMLTDALGSLDEIDPDLLPPGDLVDLEVLRTKVSADLWHTAELRPHTWNPLVYAPGEALLPLVERELLPLTERLAALASRCSALPGYLATARTRLTEGPGMPRVHVETALAQLAGDRELLTRDVPALAEGDSEGGPALKEAAGRALEAVEEHESWLRTELGFADADPRLGARSFAAQLWYTLDSELSPEALLVRAESDLLATEEAMAEAAAEYEGQPRRPGQVAEVLSALADDHPVTSQDLRSTGEQALEHLYRRTREAGIATVYDDPVQVVPMPESRRGVAVAYCRPPGPLDPDAHAQPTFIAVSPPPDDWPAERRDSFLREYNGAMLRNLMVHEGMPGHALQLAHAARHDGATRVGKLLMSGTFVEGWAVHAEEVMAGHGWSGTDSAEGRRQDLALRLVRLKTRLRMILNAILDVRMHTGDLTEEEALALLTERGHQEEGEAVGKWRRAQLTSAQLSTYYVGYTEMAAIARDLAETRPELSERERHDLMLAHGSPPPRHLRTLLEL